MRTFSLCLVLGAVFAITGSSVRAEQLQPGESSPEATEVEIYGRPLMTQEEVDAYNAQLQSNLTAEEREVFLHQHRERMAQRARERGITLPGMTTEPEESIYGQELMSPQEIDAYRKRLRELDEDERAAFLRKHRSEMTARARERSAQPPPVGSGPSDGHRPPRVSEHH